MTEQQGDEIIAAAMLLGAEFKQLGRMWQCCDTSGHATGAYYSQSSAAAGYLERRGFYANWAGELVKS
jgi:hypothetical protein